MSIIQGSFPKQRLSRAEKMKDNFKWAQDTIDFIIFNFSERGQSRDEYVENMSTYDRKLANYRLYNNVLDQRSFSRDCNLLGIDVGQFHDEIKPYNKSYNKIQVLLGEELKRPFNYKAVLVNAEGVKSKYETKNSLLREYVTTTLNAQIQRLRAKHSNIEDPEELEATIQEELDMVMDPDTIEKYMKTTFQEQREVLANRILQYLIKKESIMEKKNDGFKHGLLAGEEFVWTGIENGEPVCNVLNTLGMIYHKSPEVKYVQDGQYAGYRTRMNTTDILNKLGEYLTQDQIDRLEGTKFGVNGVRADLISRKMKYHNVDPFLEHASRALSYTTDEGSYSSPYDDEDWEVVHVEWKTQKKVGFLNFQNEFGDEQMDMVSEDFEIPPHATKSTVMGLYNKKKVIYEWDGFTLEWKWIPEVWSGIKIGGDIYCCIGPSQTQYRSVDNPWDVKLGYHGLIYNSMNAQSVSLMDRMRPFQHLYFILVHKLKKLIAKDKGQVFHFDTSMIPENLGLEKTLYYLEEMDIDFFNPLQNTEEPGAAQRGKITGSTSRSNMQHILHYVNLMNAIDEQISDVAGIARQREGQATANEAVGNVQQNIAKSTHITEATYFFPHEKLWQSVLTSMVQAAQVAWSGRSIVRQYVIDDFSTQALMISPGILADTDFGVFITNSAKEDRVFEEMRLLAQPLLQNDKAKFSDILKLMKYDSMVELEKQIELSEQRSEDRENQQLQAQQEQVQAQIEAENARQEDQQAHEIELEEMKLAAQIRMKEIDVFKFQQGLDSDNNGIPDPLELEKFKADFKLKSKKLDLDEKKMKQDAKDKEEERKLKREQIKTQKAKAKKAK